MKKIIAILLCCSFYVLNAQQKTYCIPINIDYGYTPFDVFSSQGKHRPTADPVIVNFQNKYFFNGADRTDAYYFQIEAFNSNGISERTEVIKSE